MMDPSEVERAIKKLQYQVKTLGEAIDYKNHPIEALIMQMDWGEGDIDRVHDVFEKWDKILKSGTKMSSGAFEREFSTMGINYQTLKSVILSLYRNGQWTSVCEAYVDSFGDAPSMEYHGIMRRERE
ncbi:hypothetical protein [Methylobacterium bullatum]|uniref:Uncharacterized protein n=1 Tax=Methylobacterium bullatum TaxID=570505 RepID=A0A679JE25_9HYPH|nr:hypothetical protein MBLL_00459 [Methylobacterium bullatum]